MTTYSDPSVSASSGDITLPGNSEQEYSTASTASASSELDSDSDLDSGANSTVGASSESNSGSDQQQPQQPQQPQQSQQSQQSQKQQHKKRKKKFLKRLTKEMFWDIRDDIMHLTPLSIYFLKECRRTSDRFDDLGVFISPPEVEDGTVDVPTDHYNTLTRFYVKLCDKMFLLALQELQEHHLRKDFDIKWFTIPFSPNDPEEFEVFDNDANWASDAHKEAVRLFAKTVNKMHEVKLLVANANANYTAATSILYRKVQATTYMETVRKNMWILNNRFEYERSAGGFRRIGDKRKGAIALLSSPAAAAKVVGDKHSVRPLNAKGRSYSNSKRPRHNSNDPPLPLAGPDAQLPSPQMSI